MIRTYFTIFIGVFLLACVGENSEREYVIGFSQCTGGDAWRRQMLSEMETELQFHPGMKMEFRDAKGNNDLQIAQIKELVKHHVDLLIVTPNEAAPMTPVIEEAYQSGMPVIIVDRKTKSNLYTAYIGADNYEIGKLAGSYAVGLLNGKGRILEIWGLRGSTPAVDRHKGFMDAISDFREISIVKEIEGSWEVDSVKSQLLKHPVDLDAFDLVFAHNDVMSYGAYSILKPSLINRPIKFIGIDGLPGPGSGIEMVSDGILNVTVLYPTGGEEAIQIAARVLKGEAIEKENILNSTVIDAKNVRVMKLQTDKIVNQQGNIKRQQSKMAEQIRLYSNQRILIYILTALLVSVLVIGALAILAWKEKSELNKKLETKKSEIEQQRDKIGEMARAAEEANQTKLKFFTNISHEFKTPLTLIMVPVEAILSNTADARDQLKNNATLIKQNAVRLLRLVNQLMDFRKMEDKKMVLHICETDLVAFVKDIMAAFDDVAKKRKIHFELNTSLSHLALFFDPDMLDKVIFNLLSNAFKFTKDKGTISITISVDGAAKNALIYVEDNGEGMSREYMEHAFDQFYSDDNLQGTGLGLSLSKELMDLHHGDIVLRSEKGKGTRFCVIVPFGKDHFAPEQIVKAPAPFKRNSIYDIIVDDQKQLSVENSKAQKTLHDYTVLLVEDNNDLRSFLKEQLVKFYNIEEAINGADGIRMAFESVPDIIISDVMLPVKNGFEVTQFLKNDLRTSHIPIILLTAKGTIEEKITGIQTGADEYITKPFVLEFLHERIKALIKTRESLREHYSHDLQFNPHQTTPGGHDKKFINDFRAMVEKNIDNPDFNVNEIGPELAMSRIQLYRKVKALMGCSVNDYIVHVRLKKAQYLLQSTDKTVTEISIEVGFSSPNYFSTAFKSKFNLSPKEFKSSQQG
jgi:signal transduction histidine kinase/CheY-like chemotaxis protein/AraC-like DNA-binding protein